MAMGREDYSAAREFYSQALDIPGVPPDERAKTLGNRATCLLKLKYPQTALEDAEEACELAPELGKARYRLGCVQAECGDIKAAVASLEEACELLGEANAADVRQRIATVKAEGEAMIIAAVEAVVAAGGGAKDGPKARAAARLAKAEAAMTSAQFAVSAATRAKDRAQARLMRAASGTEAMDAAMAQEQVDDREQEEEAAEAALTEAAGIVNDAKTLKAEAAAFDDSTKAASALYASGKFDEAHDAFANLIDGAAALAEKKNKSGIDGLRAAEAMAALPALYGNRAACALQMAAHHESHLYDCLHDCDDAIAAVSAATEAAASSKDDADVAPPAPPPPFKIRARRVEVKRRIGMVDVAKEELDSLRAMASTEAEKSAVEFLAASFEE